MQSEGWWGRLGGGGERLTEIGYESKSQNQNQNDTREETTKAAS